MKNPNTTNFKKYDLEERTLKFALNCRKFLKKIPFALIPLSDRDQLTRSSGSVGANYIEANEAISKKDCIHRMRICRKEAKESHYWLNLCEISNQLQKTEQEELKREALELTRIFAAIITKLT